MKPGCNSVNLDGFLVKDIIETRGYLDGLESRELGLKSPRFYELRVTLDGEEFLAKNENVVKKARNTTQWYQRPLGLIAVAVVAGVLTTFLVYVIKTELNLNL